MFETVTDMLPLRAPRVFAGGRWWPSHQIETTSRRWRALILDVTRSRTRAVGAVLPASPDGVALFVALAAQPLPLILLSPDPAFWPSACPDFDGVPLFVPPSLVSVASQAAPRGFVPHVLGDRGHVDCAELLVRTPGAVLFTSGSTGEPRPVFRSFAAIAGGAASRLDVLGIGHGAGVVIGVPLASGQGLTMVVSSLLLGGPIGLLSSLDYRSALVTLALPEFAYWFSTPHLADVLGRCTLTGSPVAPRVCLISSPIPSTVGDAFRSRFGVPLRQAYSSTETGAVAVDAALPEQVSHRSVGRPLPGVEVRIGEFPDAPIPGGDHGRIWVRSPWQMTGYGIPPVLDRPGEVDGWWPTRDLGSFDANGRLSLHGRLDDCVRTRDGRLVSLAAVEHVLCQLDGVRAAVVIPLEGLAGSVFGAVVEGGTVAEARLREQVADGIPPWARPRRLAIAASLPRLPNGKANRRACMTLLTGGRSM